MAKVRLDEFMQRENISESLDKARREILAGWVKVNGETVRDSAHKIKGDEAVSVERPKGRFISRGGEKLEKALELFSIDVKGRTAFDLGASTGGFTDCLLKRGAKKVYSVDVGYGQLDYSLRNDSRVVVMERCNARSVKRSLDCEVSFVSADISFLSFIKVYESLSDELEGVECVSLVKPQFEAAPDEHVKGIVTDPNIHSKILVRVINSLLKLGMKFRGLSFSPIKGPKGNIEFLLHFVFGTEEEISDLNLEDIVGTTVSEAHQFFNFNQTPEE